MASMGSHSSSSAAALLQSIYTTIWPQVHAKLKGILSTPIQATICNDQTKKYCLTKLHFPLHSTSLLQPFQVSRSAPLEVRKQVIHLSFDIVQKLLGFTFKRNLESSLSGFPSIIHGLCMLIDPVFIVNVN